jgi:hypothetical protein
MADLKLQGVWTEWSGNFPGLQLAFKKKLLDVRKWGPKLRTSVFRVLKIKPCDIHYVSGCMVGPKTWPKLCTQDMVFGSLGFYVCLSYNSSDITALF